MGPDPSYPEASAGDGCFLFLVIFYHVFYMCLCVGVGSVKCNYPSCSEKVVRFPGTGVMHGCEPPDKVLETKPGFSRGAVSALKLCAIQPASTVSHLQVIKHQ